jgi:hypothetical protein
MVWLRSLLATSTTTNANTPWNTELPDNPAAFSATADFRFWPILLKNSFVEADKKSLRPSGKFKFFEAEGHYFQSKIRYEAFGAVR